MKKIIAILLATFLLMSMFVLGVSAETAVTVSLNGASQAIKGEQYEVVLSAPATVGGISGEIKYDADSFSLKGIEITSAFAEANKITVDKGTDLIKDDSENGVIKFALLSGDSDKWVTFNFTTADTAATGAAFTLENVKVSNSAGTALVDNLTTDIAAGAAAVYEKALDVAGASVRTNGAADIRFEIDLGVNNYKGQIEEVGVIMIPTRFVAEGQELVYDTENVKYSGKTAKIARSSAKDIGDETVFYANLINSSATASRIKTAVSARAYIKLTDGTIIYSDNADADKNIGGGTSSRCCIDVMKSIAATKDFSDNADVTAILAKANADWTLDDYAAVVSAVNAKILG